MTWLLNSRALPSGGPVRKDLVAHSNPPDVSNAVLGQFAAACAGKDVLIATHGFNVCEADAVGNLSAWEPLMTLTGDTVFAGFLWPGDSVWLHALVYPDAAKVAKQSGDLLSGWMNQNLTNAASVSFVSHSLGARVVLETIGGLAPSFRVRKLLLMAGAIDCNCLGKEYAAAAGRVGKISNLASKQDTVLKWAFPLGNPISGLFAAGHPFWHGAIGREGPTANPPTPAQFDRRCTLPEAWNFAHSDYLPPGEVPAGSQPLPYGVPIDCPASGSGQPAANTPAGYTNAQGVLSPAWKSAWTAAFESSLT